MDQLKTFPQDEPASIGAFDKFVAFMKRDVRSFMPGWQKTVSAELEPVTVNVEIDVDSLVDPGNVDCLIFRRNVLDWRDNFHARVTISATDLRDAFVVRIKNDLGQVSILRRHLFTRKASEVLQGHFIHEVRVPMRDVIQQEQKKLEAIIERWLPQKNIKVDFISAGTVAECECLGDLKFTPGNQEKILEKMNLLILGDDGGADIYRDRATHLARRVMEEKEC